MNISKILLLIWIVLVMSACSPGGDESTQEASPPPEPPVENTAVVHPESAPAQTEQEFQDPTPENPAKFVITPAEQGLPVELAPIENAWTGDFDQMVERRVIRVLTVYQMGGYFLDGPQEKGLTFDLVKLFEKSLNEKLETGHVKLHVVLIPVDPDQLIPGLLQGYGDIAAAGLTITPEREALVDFGEPLSREVREIIVTGPGAPEISDLEGLAGQTVFVEADSSYKSSLEQLNLQLADQGLAPIQIQEAPEHLKYTDLLEMANAGLFPMIAIDDYKARFWGEIFPDIELRDDLVLAGDRRIAWAIRKNSPLLKAEVDAFAQANRQGTLMGNILIKRYLKNYAWARNALAAEDLGRYQSTAEIFRRYADQYGFDFLMMAAQGYQESRLDQSMRSPAGAVGIMQLLPSTAADKNVGIPDIYSEEPNIHAGIKYMNFIRDRYFSGPELDPLNRALFSFAAYNAGPARVRQLRNMAADVGLDPNRWFNHVELMAAREIGRETVQYVSNIYKYYLAYRISADRLQNKTGSE